MLSHCVLPFMVPSDKSAVISLSSFIYLFFPFWILLRLLLANALLLLFWGLFNLTGCILLSFFLFFLFIFWPHCVACRILVLQSGIEPVTSVVKVWSANHWSITEFPIIVFFMFLFLGDCWIFWAWRLTIFNKFGKIMVMIYLQMFFLLHVLFSWNSGYIYIHPLQVVL